MVFFNFFGVCASATPSPVVEDAIVALKKWRKWRFIPDTPHAWVQYCPRMSVRTSVLLQPWALLRNSISIIQHLDDTLTGKVINALLKYEITISEKYEKFYVVNTQQQKCISRDRASILVLEHSLPLMWCCIFTWVQKIRRKPGSPYRHYSDINV